MADIDLGKASDVPKGASGKQTQKVRKSGDATRRKKSRFSVDVQSMLVKDEHVVEQGVIHNAIYWPAVAVLIFAFLVSVFIVVEIGALLAFVSVLMFIHATIKKELLLFVLTNKRMFVRYGILQVDVVDIRFSKIESVELERMLPGYIFGYANLVVMGTGNRYIVIPYIANGVQIRRSYNQMTLSDEKPQEVVVVNDKAE